MAKKWNFDDRFPASNADVRHLLKKKSRSEITAAISGSFSEQKTKAKEIRERKAMDAYWREHAETLEEPFRTQLLDALDLFAEFTKSLRQRNLTEPPKPTHPK